MKKILFFSVPLLLSMNVYADISDSEKESLCNQAVVDDAWLMRPTHYTGEVFEGSSTRYVSTSSPASFEAEQNHYVDYDGSGLPEYRTTRDFAFFKAFGKWSTLELVRGMSSDEDIQMSYPIRGENRAVVLVKDETLTQTGGPAGSPWYIPLCDVIEVIAHNKPTVGSASISGGNSIKVTVENVSIDNLSERASKGLRPSITYTFQNAHDSHAVDRYTTTSTDINFSPAYKGYYYVSATVSDGNLKRYIDVTKSLPVQYLNGQPLPGGDVPIELPDID